jgi:hypothetical protein
MQCKVCRKDCRTGFVFPSRAPDGTTLVESVCMRYGLLMGEKQALDEAREQAQELENKEKENNATKQILQE